MHAMGAMIGLCTIASMNAAHGQIISDAPQVAETPDVERIQVTLGQSLLIDSPWPVARVSITDPEVADVQVLSPLQLLLTGNALGTTSLIIWNENDEAWHSRVRVVVDLMYLEDELARLFPECDLVIHQSGDMVVVRGSLCRTAQAGQLKQFLDTVGVKYVDMTNLAGIQQVMLEVKVAEVSRRAIRSLGINAYYAGNDFIGGSTIGSAQGGPINPINIGVPEGAVVGSSSRLPFSFLDASNVASGVTLFGAVPGSDFAFFLEALEENQYLRLLAEPTLVAMSGEEASFLAGGEFPIPIVQGSTAGAGTSITVEYKEFGVQLGFAPIVLGDNSIRLTVSPEVSDLSEFGAVEIEGFSIPSVLTRRAETTLEMKSGQTFAIAGLLNSNDASRISKVPLLGDLPIIGALFRSVRYQTQETELVVLVTASLVEPMDNAKNRPVPGDLHVNPSDWELYADGKSEGRLPALDSVEAGWLSETGLDRLKGPGAWATYEQAPARSEVMTPSKR